MSKTLVYSIQINSKEGWSSSFVGAEQHAKNHLYCRFKSCGLSPSQTVEQMITCIRIHTSHTILLSQGFGF